MIVNSSDGNNIWVDAISIDYVGSELIVFRLIPRKS